MNHILNKLKGEGVPDADTCNLIEREQKERLFSVYWHIKTILYLGVTMLAGGLGILVYKNIDTIGHLAIISVIGLLVVSCFFYCFKKSLPFSTQKVESPGMGYDYILLLGCLLFLTFLGYLQWQYLVFGDRYGLATFIPAIIMLAVAYRFDHLGILTLGITLFSAWCGLAITPRDLLSQNDFSSFQIIYTGIGLALLFGASSFLHEKYDVKKHFSFTYLHFAIHLAGISLLSGVFVLGGWFIFIPLLLLALFATHRYAIKQQSFYLILVTLFYGYIALSYVIFKILVFIPAEISIYIGMACFIFSSIYLIKYLRNIKRSFRKDAVLS